MRLSIPLTGGVPSPRYVGRAITRTLLTINAAWTAVIMTPAGISCVTKAEDVCVLSAFTIHIMYSYHYAPGPACRGLAFLYVPPLNYKREGTQRYRGQTLNLTCLITYSIQLTHSGGRVLRSGGLNHYIPHALSCSSRILQTGKPLRPPPHLRIRAGVFHHPAEGFPHRQSRRARSTGTG
jgi:hypothetical protein